MAARGRIKLRTGKAILRLGKHPRDLGFAAGGSVLFYDASFQRFVYCLVCGGKRLGVALLCCAYCFERTAQRIFARVVKYLAAHALTICFFGGRCNCHGADTIVSAGNRQ